MTRPRRRKPTKASSFTRTCSIPREHLGLALSSPLESIALASTRITEKGQVTVPIEVRRSLGLKPGDEVEFILDGQGARVVRAATTPTRGRRLTDRLRDKGDVHLTRVTFGHLRRNAVRHPFAGRVMHHKVLRIRRRPR